MIEQIRTRDGLGREDIAIENAIRESVEIALRWHKRMGYPIVTYRDGKIVWVPPEEIDVLDEGPLPPLEIPF